MLAMNREQDDGKNYATPPSPWSHNPYNRGGFLQRKSLPPPSPPRKFDLGVHASGRGRGRGATGTRPLPLRTPPNKLLHDSAGTDVYMTPRGRHINEPRVSTGSPSRESRHCSPASSRSASPQKPPWYPAGSPASSRSASPHKRPWYPAGCRPSSGESGRSFGGGQENMHVVHPTFRHLFNETANRSDVGDDAEGDVGVDDTCGTMHRHGTAVPGVDMGGSPCSSPQTAATVPQRSETDIRNKRSATGERRRGNANAQRSTEKNNLPNKQRRDKPAGSGRTHNNDMSRRKGRNEGPRTDEREEDQHDAFRESVAMVRDRVRSLQSRGKPRIRENGLSADGRRRARPTPLSSAVFTGHSEQVLALAQHQDVMFSAAADGTAKVSALFTRQMRRPSINFCPRGRPGR